MRSALVPLILLYICSSVIGCSQVIGEAPQRVEEIIMPDGALYFLTNNIDGRGSPRSGADKIYRIVPKE